LAGGLYAVLMLRLTGLRKTFGTVVAVDGLSLEIRRGEVFGLLGPNGAGKTTTISLAVGQLRPDAGTVELNGAGSPADPYVRRCIGVAPQALALYDELSGEENLRFFGRLYGLGGGTLRQRVARLLDFVGLTERRRDRVATYSGGMKRRLNLAVALVHEPALILLDEPTAGVDPQSRNAIFEFVQTLKSEGRTVVYTTHYMEEAQRLCDRVAIMDHGRLLALDTVAGLLRQAHRPTVVVVERAAGEQRIETPDPKAELARALQQPDVLGARIERPDLESVFLALTGRRLRD
jgi:ABC-2 type transport system ATP-binding protein